MTIKERLISIGQKHIPLLGVILWVLLLVICVLPDWGTVAMKQEHETWTLTRYEEMTALSVTHVCAFVLSGVSVVGFNVAECKKKWEIYVYASIYLPAAWRGNAYTLDTLFLSVISQLDGLQWKQYEGRDGNLFTHFHILEAEGLTSVCCCGGRPLSTLSKLMAKPYLQFKNCSCWGAAF